MFDKKFEEAGSLFLDCDYGKAHFEEKRWNELRAALTKIAKPMKHLRSAMKKRWQNMKRNDLNPKC